MVSIFECKPVMSSACDSTSACNCVYRVSACLSSDDIDCDAVEMAPDAFAIVDLSGLFSNGVAGLAIPSCAAAANDRQSG